MKHWSTALERLRRALARTPEPDLDEASPEEPPAALPSPRREVAEITPVAREEAPTEFEDLLSSIGSEREAPSAERLLARKDAEIFELRGMLQALSPLGERLADIDRARLDEEESAADEGEVREELEQRLTDARDRAAHRRARVVAMLRRLRGEHGALEGCCEQLASQVLRLEAETPEGAVPMEVPVDTTELEERIAELEAIVAKREAAVERTKGWHAKAKAKAEEKSKLAAERWREILTLRREVKAMERK